jgi:hypothetical protein
MALNGEKFVTTYPTFPLAKTRGLATMNQMNAKPFATSLNRRKFLGALPLCGTLLQRVAAAPEEKSVSFFVVGDTHYCAQEDHPELMQEISLKTNQGLLRWLNEIPGKTFPAELGGAEVL